MSDSYDDWDWDDNARVEDYLEDRIEEYLERLERDPYDAYYDRRNSPLSSKSKGNNKYKALLSEYIISLERLLDRSKSKNLKPAAYTVISGSGPAWYYEPSTRKLIKTERGSEIVVIPGEPDEQGRMLVRTMNTFLLIPEEDILHLGYN
tara:strand:+ start:194 stop:640 length:447 start_codon:yes stop_codon:yes gene_type:complete